MTIADRFERFHVDNPVVYDALVDLCFEMHGRGMRRVSMDWIYHIARWDIIKRTNNNDYKLNDHYTAFYSRLIMTMNPQLGDDFFETRTSQADTWLVSPSSELMRNWVSQVPRS